MSATGATRPPGLALARLHRYADLAGLGGVLLASGAAAWWFGPSAYYSR